MFPTTGDKPSEKRNLIVYSSGQGTKTKPVVNQNNYICSTKFKETFGMTPSQYAQNGKKPEK